MILAIVACLTLGLAPYSPEPHIVGKIRWIAGGAEGMQVMDYLDLLIHGLPWIVLIYFLFQKYFGNSNAVINEIYKKGEYHLIDVREPQELESNSIDGAVNIPLSSLKSSLKEIQKLQGPKILFCRSGMRSGQALRMLKSNGIDEVYNGGGIQQVKGKLGRS